jgi:hypothetical protein
LAQDAKRANLDNLNNPQPPALSEAEIADAESFLVEKGVLDAQDKSYTFTQDYEFNSPSTAAGIVLGRTANGRIEWKDAKGVTLKEMQERESSGEK